MLEKSKIIVEGKRSDVSSRADNPIQIQGAENGITNNNEISSFKILASQLIIIFPIVFLKIYYGIGQGFTSVLIPELSKENEHAEIDLTLDELTWFSSYCFVIPIASICGGFIAQIIGIRRLLLLSYLLYILSGLIFHWANNVTMISSAQIIVGVTHGISRGPSYTYVAEIMQPKLRSITFSALNLSVSFGMFLPRLLENFVYWRVLALGDLIFPIIGFIFIHFIPESPQWLANKNRFEEAEKSLARLRGWTTPEAVKAELYSSINSFGTLSSSMESSRETHLNASKQTKWKKTLSLFLDRSFYIPLLIMSTMFFFAICSGPSSVQEFSVLIFNKINSPINGRVGNAIFSGSSIVSVFVYIFTVRFVGKRKLTLASVCITSISFTIAVTLLFLINNNQLTSEVYSWILTISLMTTIFANNSGIGKIIYILNSELFPQHMRYIGAGSGFFVHDIMSAVMSKTYLYIVEAITFPGILILFAVINAVAIVVIYFILPETEGVPLHQIEEQYAGARKFRR